MKIAIVVHGRFHGFDLARALSERGHEVTLLTNYPRWAARRFGVGYAEIRSFWPHGVVSRAMPRLGIDAEAALHSAFGRWAAKEIGRESWDVIHCWSGVSLEILRAYGNAHGTTLLMRGSAHIRTQARILEEEERRTRVPLERPSAWMIEREENEYALADKILVLSRFTYDSFISEKIPREKLRLLPLGADCQAFRPSRETIQLRCQRILQGHPLRVLHVGTVSFQKGMWDAAQILRALGTERFRFKFVGAMPNETKNLAADLRDLAEFVPKQPQRELTNYYAWADVFFAPTLQDGFQIVLGQVGASALPILTTTNGAGLDLVRENETGWIVPIRSPGAFVERLRWCDSHREELAAMVEHLYHTYQPRDWSDVGGDFERICQEISSPRDVSVAANRI
jgi:glycosyltransferase involved in cell wall biosynthesis